MGLPSLVLLCFTAALYVVFLVVDFLAFVIILFVSFLAFVVFFSIVLIVACLVLAAGRG